MNTYRQTGHLGLASTGQGPNITLVHGWGLGPQAWAPLLPELETHFTVNRLAMPGYAGIPAWTGATLEDFADALAAQLPPRATLCGWSLGAMLCLLCASRHPNKVARLVLIGGTASFIQREGWSAALPPAQLADFQQQLAEDPLPLLHDFSALIHIGDKRRKSAQQALNACLANGLPADISSLAQGLDFLEQTDLRAATFHVDQPTLLLHGANDPLMPVAAAHALAERLSSATLQVLDDAAHAPFAANPAAFASILRGFVVGGL